MYPPRLVPPVLVHCSFVFSFCLRCRAKAAILFGIIATIHCVHAHFSENLTWPIRNKNTRVLGLVPTYTRDRRRSCVEMAYQTQGGSEWRQTPNPVGEGRHWRPRNPYEQQQQGQSVGEKRVRERDDNSVAGGGATVREPSENPTDNPPGGDEPLVSEQKRARLEEEEGETSSTGDNKGAEGGSQDEEGKEPDKPGDMEHRRVRTIVFLNSTSH